MSYEDTEVLIKEIANTKVKDVPKLIREHKPLSWVKENRGLIFGVLAGIAATALIYSLYSNRKTKGEEVEEYAGMID